MNMDLEKLHAAHQEKAIEIDELIIDLQKRLGGMAVNNWFDIAMMGRVAHTLRSLEPHLPKIE